MTYGRYIHIIYINRKISIKFTCVGLTSACPNDSLLNCFTHACACSRVKQSVLHTNWIALSQHLGVLWLVLLWSKLRGKNWQTHFKVLDKGLECYKLCFWSATPVDHTYWQYLLITPLDAMCCFDCACSSIASNPGYHIIGDNDYVEIRTCCTHMAPKLSSAL